MTTPSDPPSTAPLPSAGSRPEDKPLSYWLDLVASCIPPKDPNDGPTDFTGRIPQTVEERAYIGHLARGGTLSFEVFSRWSTEVMDQVFVETLREYRERAE